MSPGSASEIATGQKKNTELKSVTKCTHTHTHKHTLAVLQFRWQNNIILNYDCKLRPNSHIRAQTHTRTHTDGQTDKNGPFGTTTGSTIAAAAKGNDIYERKEEEQEEKNPIYWYVNMTFNAQLFPACASQATEITNVCSINYVVVVDSRPRCTHRNTPGKAIHAEPIAGAHTHGPTNTQAGVGLWKKRLKFYLFWLLCIYTQFFGYHFPSKMFKKS